MENIGKVIVGLGAVLIVVGLAFWLFPNKLNWVGHLPGDIWIERPGFSFYMPITTMLLLSLGLSLGAWVVGKLLNQ